MSDRKLSVVSIRRIDEERRIVYGEVYAPNTLDTYGEFMLPEDIEEMAHRFLKTDLSNSIDTNHDNVPNGSYPVESYIVRWDDPDFTVGSWVLGVKIPDDDIWNKVKSGDLNAYSFQSLVSPVKYEAEIDVIRDHAGLVEKHKSDGHDHAFFLQLSDEGQVIGGETSLVNGHRHKIMRASITEKASGHNHRFFI